MVINAVECFVACFHQLEFTLVVISEVKAVAPHCVTWRDDVTRTSCHVVRCLL